MGNQTLSELEKGLVDKYGDGFLLSFPSMSQLDPEIRKRLPFYMIWALEQLERLKKEKRGRRRKRTHED